MIIANQEITIIIIIVKIIVQINKIITIKTLKVKNLNIIMIFTHNIIKTHIILLQISKANQKIKTQKVALFMPYQLLFFSIFFIMMLHKELINAKDLSKINLIGLIKYLLILVKSLKKNSALKLRRKINTK